MNPLNRSASTTALSSPQIYSKSTEPHKGLPVQQVRNQHHRVLDIYGIDDNRERLSKLPPNEGKIRVLINKVEGSSANLTGGAYVSKPGENTYGDFNWLNSIGLIKYQAEQVAVVKFKELDQLKKLSEFYSETPLPAFLVQILNSEECLDTQLYQKNPALAEFIAPVDKMQHGFLIRPNSPYSSERVLDIYAKSPETLAKNKQGITLCTYAIHPGIKSSFLEKHQYHQDFKSIDVNRSTKQATIDEKTKIKSLTTILDLTPEHLPQLEALKKGTLQHLKNVYHTDSSDTIRMFFHFPVAEKTATLHLHTWVNKGDHPLNEPRSFHLNVIIEHLRERKNMSELILRGDKNGAQIYLPTSDTIKDIPGIPLEGIIHNPLLLPLE